LIEDTEKINSLTAEVDELKVWWQLNHFVHFSCSYFYLSGTPSISQIDDVLDIDMVLKMWLTTNFCWIYL
jgi:hypothetical protein